jgi:tetratricopeptide (TPR) repeat protein
MAGDHVGQNLCGSRRKGYEGNVTGLRRAAPALVFLFLLTALTALSAQDFEEVAEQYVFWAEEAAAAGRWDEALAGLERAADYADVSSDLSYLLALARSRTGKPRGAVLEALGRAGEAGRWRRYSPEAALLLEAETLIALRNFSGALNLLARRPADADGAALRLSALRGLPDLREFRRVMEETLERYPRDPRPAEVFFEYAKGKTPEGIDQALMDLALRRLPYLLDAEPRLAVLAAPFIKDREEARRLLGAYRGAHRPVPASIPPSLSLGLIDELAAVEELFAPPASEAGKAAGMTIDKDLIGDVFALLKADEARRLFRGRLFRFSGLITADADRDGVPESRARYRDGVIGEFTWVADQDGLAELAVYFDAGGMPLWAEQVTLPDSEDSAESPDSAALPAAGPAAAAGADIPAGRVFALPLRDADRTKARIFWERYPWVQRSELAGAAYMPAPGTFLFNPVTFVPLAEGEPGMPYPVVEGPNIRISRRTLASFSRTVRRPSGEFEGAVEWIDLLHGVPLRAAEILDGRPVAVTEFVRGKPVVQRIDLDLDGRMETVRRFQGEAGESGGEDLPDYKKIIRFSESDWDGDGIFETGEQYLSDGTVVYSWDMDGDGEREYSEIKGRE